VLVGVLVGVLVTGGSGCAVPPQPASTTSTTTTTTFLRT
jgi:hypothetical protein